MSRDRIRAPVLLIDQGLLPPFFWVLVTRVPSNERNGTIETTKAGRGAAPERHKTKRPVSGARRTSANQTGPDLMQGSQHHRDAPADGFIHPPL